MTPEPERKPPLDASAVDDLARRTRRFFSELANDYVRQPVEELLRGVFRRAGAWMIASVLFATAAVFLLIGGVGGLEEAGVPSWAAYLALGGTGLMAGLIVLRAIGPRS